MPRRLDSPFLLRPGIGPHEVTSRDLNALVDPGSKDGARLVEAAQAFFARRDAGVLLVLQSVNAGGKDGAITELHDTLGREALAEHRFRRPAEPQTLDEFLTETARKLPSPGELVIFNRSYYETPFKAAYDNEPELPDQCARIVAFEHDLARRPVRVAKAFIHIGRGEQLARLEARQANPDLRHLHNERDFADQGDWHELMAAFGLVMTKTHTDESPWLVIPGDDRATRNAVVAALLVELLSP